MSVSSTLHIGKSSLCTYLVFNGNEVHCWKEWNYSCKWGINEIERRKDECMATIIDWRFFAWNDEIWRRWSSDAKPKTKMVPQKIRVWICPVHNASKYSVIKKIATKLQFFVCKFLPKCKEKSVVFHAKDCFCWHTEQLMPTNKLRSRAVHVKRLSLLSVRKHPQRPK